MTGETISVEGIAVQVRKFSGAKEVIDPLHVAFKVVSIDGSIVIEAHDRDLFIETLGNTLRSFRR